MVRGSDADRALTCGPVASPWRAAHTRRLPGAQPLKPADWIWRDAAYGAQMALRRSLLTGRPGDVVACQAEAREAAHETYTRVRHALAHDPDYTLEGAVVTCPDGAVITCDPDQPLANLGRLVQQDLCLLTRGPGDTEHRLRGAVLCFPAGWTLAEKLGMTLTRIHLPVEVYGDEIARRVQRLCDAVTWERPLTRANFIPCDDTALFAPRREAQGHPERQGRYVRVERQSLRRLPDTGTLVFGIHTSLTPWQDLDEEDRSLIRAAWSAEM